MNWNYNMDEAPRGTTVTETRNGPKGTQIKREVFKPAKIIACSPNCKTVTVTHWMPNAERWEFFADGQEPLAWMSWPEHPGLDQ